MSFFVRHKGLTPVKPTPNPYPSRLPRWRQHVGLLPFLCLLFLGGAFRLSPFTYAYVQQALFEGVTWFQGAVVHPLHELLSFFEEGNPLIHVRQNAESLRLENETLKWKVQQLESLGFENATLRRALNIPDVAPYKSIAAPILATPYDGLHHVFLIGEGLGKNIEKNQAVVVPEGVVGRIDTVGKQVARVLLLNDRHSRIPVVTSRSEQKAILAGEGERFPVLVYVGDTQKIIKGETVVTSGLGGVFPGGLPVGIVEDVVNGKIRVRPCVSFQKLNWVYILQLHSKEALKEIATALEGGEG